ncbi:3-beta hydroxysteroid dehydrogenase [Paenibacillus sp. CFBP13512]|uniref:NAD(P)-dependent oxidoreductase n=1 Tax=Paenibacillus sp. CFBP13512 TaxID=2184007 RepID=UPI0010BFD760|nr:NAD(P)-dependent oxidoreductase [Paenibacillus sp. CFBP13512]TKJ84105.1 3-beta hydroxysteroid dehydrogenase [Paenibacillus sp. CFBP13512]
MKIAIIGATGTIGQRLVQEGLRRKYEITAATRDSSKIDKNTERLQGISVNVLDPISVEAVVAGHDVVINAFGPQFGNEGELIEAASAVVEGMKRAGVHRLLVVGGAGSLEVEPGVRLMDTPDFPAEIRPLAQAHVDAYEIYSQSDLDWTYVSPASWIEPGKRTGNFRIGTNRLVTDDDGASRISIEDYAAALFDEVEDPLFTRTRFTVAY